MADKTLQIEIVTPTRKVFSGTAKSVVAPGIEGYFGVLPRHAPLLAMIDIGEVTIKSGPGDEQIFATAGGFAEVSSDKMIILSEAAESADEIDLDRARTAKERAEKRLQEGRENWDVARARTALSRAINRIQIAGK